MATARQTQEELAPLPPQIHVPLAIHSPFNTWTPRNSKLLIGLTMILNRTAFALCLTGLIGASAAYCAQKSSRRLLGNDPESVVRILPIAYGTPIRTAVRSWQEKGAPKCLMIAHIYGSIISYPDSVDFAMRDGQFYRAKLMRGCASSDFYAGVYIQTTDDGRLCEDRDRLQSRTNGACEINKFVALRPPK